MSTICKLDPTVRTRRRIRRQVRRQLAVMAQAFQLSGDMKGALTYRALVERLAKVTNHTRFLAILKQAGGDMEAVNAL
jgi:hypothetical protein